MRPEEIWEPVRNMEHLHQMFPEVPFPLGEPRQPRQLGGRRLHVVPAWTRVK